MIYENLFSYISTWIYSFLFIKAIVSSIGKDVLKQYFRRYYIYHCYFYYHYYCSKVLATECEDTCMCVYFTYVHTNVMKIWSIFVQALSHHFILYNPSYLYSYFHYLNIEWYIFRINYLYLYQIWYALVNIKKTKRWNLKGSKDLRTFH